MFSAQCMLPGGKIKVNKDRIAVFTNVSLFAAFNPLVYHKQRYKQEPNNKN